MLKAISPVDGRYAGKTIELQDYFSEFALIKYRVKVEVAYLLALAEEIPDYLSFTEEQKGSIQKIENSFSQEDAEAIKSIEQTTNHDVKAVEYFIKDEMKKAGMDHDLEFVHFALTSQDINNTALPLQMSHALKEVLLPEIIKVKDLIEASAKSWWNIPMLSRTHGQPASPSTMGKEMMVFVDRLNHQVESLKTIELKAKFGGATGQFNAHVAAFPKNDWPKFADQLIEGLGLKRSQWTTQIGHYDDHAEVFDALKRINTILIDLARDIWTYISIQYFNQRTIANEVGSSAMPHKVNPIDFENAEGNLAFANAMLGFFSGKLPISRLQRDLTDSTVTRNIGLPFGHMIIALKSLKKGWSKIDLNQDKLTADLDDNWAVLAEAIQTVLRRERYPAPYEALKALTRGKGAIDEEVIRSFISSLDVNDQIKEELRQLTPFNYTGILR